MRCDLQIFFNPQQNQPGQWKTVACVEPLLPTDVKKGIYGACHFSYDLDYATEEEFSQRVDLLAVSCRYPVHFELHLLSVWPAFILDILPTGAGRRFLLQQLNLKDGLSADWELLLKGAGNPPGNLRVAQAIESNPIPIVGHPGFDYQEIIARQDHFIEYAYSHGAPITGSTGAQGDAPKFLLTQDKKGRWHADGALEDSLASQHWLVKFPRGKLESDRIILRNEAAYYQVAQKMELRVGALPRLDHDVLFIPRFDRQITSNGVWRLGLESLCSLAGISEFGAVIRQETLCEAILTYSTNPEEDLLEFVLRDILNIALGNTDNHARNTAVIKKQDGSVTLSPLYDFAPMFLDEQMIPRACRWSSADDHGSPNWEKVFHYLKSLDIKYDLFSEKVRKWKTKLESLPQILNQCGVEPSLIKRVQPRIQEVKEGLEFL